MDRIWLLFAPPAPPEATPRSAAPRPARSARSAAPPPSRASREALLLGLVGAAGVGGQRGDEGLLRDVDPPDGLHPLLALLLLLQQLALAGDVAAVALGEHILAHRPDVLPGDDPGP